MSDLPLISIIIPAYNHQDYIEECLMSVANQDYPNKELVIINDGSTDDTHTVIERCLYEIQHLFVNIQYINQANQGLIATLNKAISLIQAEYYLLCASDDYLFSTKALSKLYKTIIGSKSIALAWGDCIIVNSASQRVAWNDCQNTVDIQHENVFKTTHDFHVRDRSDITNLGSYQSLLNGNYISNAPLFRTAAVLDVGGYQESMGFEDWGMWLSLAQKYDLSYCDEVLGAYRWHESNTITNTEKMRKLALTTLHSQQFFCKKNRDLYHNWEKNFYMLDYGIQISQSKGVKKYALKIKKTLFKYKQKITKLCLIFLNH